MMLFPKALFFLTNIPEIIKGSIYPIEFYQKLSKFSKTVFFFQSREYLTHKGVARGGKGGNSPPPKPKKLL